ncbi:MAG: NAD(P)-dependent oxidoreductase [Bacteroidia bacterium]
MKKIRVALIREGKMPHDKRVGLSPSQCLYLQKIYPHVEFVIQPSNGRSIPDQEYIDAGLNVQEDISMCDIMIGIKEVPKPELIPGKIYLFFSHTIKKQPHNKELLQIILEKKIQLIDYECLVDDKDNRIIGFGRYAGIVGAYDTMRAFGLKYKKFKLRSAQDCEHKSELEKELKKVKLGNIKILVTGGGRVANGVTEILGMMKLRRVTPYEFLMFPFAEPVYAQVHSSDYHYRKDGHGWDNEHFHHHPEQYLSAFKKFTYRCDMLIHCAFWSPQAPQLFTLDEMADSKFKIKVIGDITCDINGSIPSTTKATTIEKPYFDYDPVKKQIIEGIHENTITTMAVDNLPCSLPRDASESFGQELIEKVLPLLFNDPENEMIERASITKNGKLTERYEYLSDYVG